MELLLQVELKANNPYFLSFDIDYKTTSYSILAGQASSSIKSKGLDATWSHCYTPLPPTRLYDLFN